MTEASGHSGVAIRPGTNIGHATVIRRATVPSLVAREAAFAEEKGVEAEDDRMTLLHAMAVGWGRRALDLIKHRASKTHRSVYIGG